MKKFIIETYNWFEKKLRLDALDTYSAQSAFFIIIAIIPFVLVLLSFFTLIDIEGQTVIEKTIELLPDGIAQFFSAILSFDHQPFTFFSVAFIACVWSSSKAMLALIKGLNAVFDVQENRNYFILRAISILYTLAFAVILIATTIVMVFGNNIYSLINSYIDISFVDKILDFKGLIAIVILTIFFSITFKLIPFKARVPFRFCAIGAFLSAVAWVVYSTVFSYFVDNFSSYSDIYGSLAILIIVMLWLYFCMYIMLFGGEIAVWLYRIKPYKKIFKR